MDKLFRWKALHLFGAGLLSLGIFSACSDELADAPKRVQAPQADPIENYIGKVNLAIEATMMPIGEDGARLQYLLGPRQLKQAVHANNGSSDANAQLRSSGGGAGGGSSEDGNPLEGNKPDADLDNTSYNADYFAPFLSIGEVERTNADGTISYKKIPGYLVFIYDDGSASPTVFRKAVDFEVIETAKLVKVNGADNYGGYKIQGHNRVRFTGDINFPAVHSLSKAFAEGSNSTPGVADFPISTETYNKITSEGGTLKKSKWKVQAYLGYSDKSAGNDKVYFGTDKNQTLKENSTATTFAPKVNDKADLQTPCVSEWTDLHIVHKGGNAPYTGINSKFKFKPQGLLLQYDIDVEMFDPTEVRSAGLISNALTFAGYYDLSDASIRTAYKQKNTASKGVPEFQEVLTETMSKVKLALRYSQNDINALTTERNTSNLMYPFYMPQLIDERVGGLAPASDKITLTGTPVVTLYNTDVTLGAGTELGSRKIFTFWAMPRKEMPAKRHTYMFLKTGNASQADASSQPAHILHQTAKDFSASKGHVVYAKGILNSNLIFTEVLSHIAKGGRTTESGPNGKDSDPYASLVELYNPMAYPVRLDDYYLVGMRMKGSTMKFVKTPRQNPTDADFDPNLQNAYLIPLKTILWHHKFGNKTQSGSLYEIPRKERKTATFYVPSMGAMKELALSGNGATANYADKEYQDYHYLLPGQTLLIGGHLWYSYARKLITTDTWYNSISDKLKEAYSEAGGYQLKGVFYHSKADEETSMPVSPLDLMPGDAVALVKVVNNQRYIIDATAPISSNAQGPFAGTLSKYKTEVIDKHANDEFFIMKRNDKVNFPFIPPYRTQRVNANAWSDDWTISTNKDDLTLGYRIKNTTRKWHKIDGTWARTPLAKWATYLNARPEH